MIKGEAKPDIYPDEWFSKTRPDFGEKQIKSMKEIKKGMRIIRCRVGSEMKEEMEVLDEPFIYPDKEGGIWIGVKLLGVTFKGIPVPLEKIMAGRSHIQTLVNPDHKVSPQFFAISLANESVIPFRNGEWWAKWYLIKA